MRLSLCVLVLTVYLVSWHCVAEANQGGTGNGTNEQDGQETDNTTSTDIEDLPNNETETTTSTESQTKDSKLITGDEQAREQSKPEDPHKEDDTGKGKKEMGTAPEDTTSPGLRTSNRVESTMGTPGEGGINKTKAQQQQQQRELDTSLQQESVNTVRGGQGNSDSIHQEPPADNELTGLSHAGVVTHAVPSPNIQQNGKIKVQDDISPPETEYYRKALSKGTPSPALVPAHSHSTGSPSQVQNNSHHGTSLHNGVKPGNTTGTNTAKELPDSTGYTDGTKASTKLPPTTPIISDAKTTTVPSPTPESKLHSITPLPTVSNLLPLHHSVEKADGSLGSTSLFALAALATLAVAAAAPAH